MLKKLLTSVVGVVNITKLLGKHQGKQLGHTLQEEIS